ncbi:MAG TPA: TonB-dependent receptor [Thermoanaerobaculia bacterium]|jgi:vitamin B12 transporter|nr:TonB-dependent receptor [Thermoanaerobaculia bacterium]
MRRILLILAAGILGGGLPVLAQEPAPVPVPVFHENVVVTASAVSTDSEVRADVPATVTVIDGKEIEARQSRDLADLLGSVPGLSVVQAGSPGQQTSVFIRGTNSNQTLLLWNGIPLNDPYFGGANWQFIPLDGVSRVEVVRGPYSALYGSDAVGGVVQVLTGTRQGGTVNVEGGDNAYKRAGLAAGFDLGRARLDVTGHIRRGDGEFANDSFDSEEGVARILFPVGAGSSLGLMVRANDSQTGIPFSGLTPTPERNISWQEREVAVPFRSEQGAWGVEAQVSRTDFDSAFRDRQDTSGFGSSDTQSQALRGRAVATWHGDDLRFAFGGEVQRLEVTALSGSFTNLDGAHQRTWAAFGQASWGTGPIHLDLGLRRDDNDVYGGQTSLRTGAVVKLSDDTRLRASYGEAFRAPALGDLFFPGSGNPDLKPERDASYEVGLEHEAGGWRLAVTGFQNRLRNLIDFDLATFSSVNVGRARIRGVEAEVGVRRGIVSASLDGTWMDPKNLDTGLELLRRPKKSAHLAVTARPGRWTLSAVGRWIGEREDLDPVTFGNAVNPSYTRFDVAAKWRAYSWLSPYARVENVADETYSAALGFPSPGRTLIGGLAFDF